MHHGQFVIKGLALHKISQVHDIYIYIYIYERENKYTNTHLTTNKTQRCKQIIASTKSIFNLVFVNLVAVTSF